MTARSSNAMQEKNSLRVLCLQYRLVCPGEFQDRLYPKITQPVETNTE